MKKSLKKTVTKTGKQLKPEAKAPAKPLKKPLRKPLPKSEHVTKKAATDAPVKAAPKAVPMPPPKPKTGPVPVIPKGFKFKGAKDVLPANRKAGFLLVDPKDMPDSFPALSKKCVPGSKWRVDVKGRKVTALVTEMPTAKGDTAVHVAWDTCGVCSNHVTRCACNGGILHNRGVEWIYIRNRMRADGLPTGTGDPVIDSTHWEVTSRAPHWYKGRETGRVPQPTARPTRTAQPPQMAAQVSTGTGAPLAAAKPSKGLSRAAGKPLGRKPLAKAGKSLGKREQVDVSNLDLSQLNQDAAKSADALADSLAKSLSSPKKSLKKRSK